MGTKAKARTAGRTAPARGLDPWLLAVLALTLLAYLPALGNDFVNWDDDQYVYDNPKIREGGVASLPSHFFERRDGRWKLPNVMGNYHPLTMISLHLDAWLAGRDVVRRAGRETDLHATVFHVTNVALHLANTWLVFLLVRALADAWRQAAGAAAPAWLEPRRAALAAAALFGVATLHVESVAWVSERKDVLYTFFVLLSLRAYVGYARRGRPADYRAALGLFVLALLSKGQAVTLAATLPLVDWLLRRPLRGRVLVEKLPFVALALVFGLIAVHTQRDGGNVLVRDAVQPHHLRPFFAAYGLVQYAVKLIVPQGLLAHYPYSLATGLGAALYAFLPLALALVGGALWLARRSPLLGFGPLFFLVSVAPVLQLLPVGSAVMADRYSYLPSVGICLLLALAFQALRHGSRRPQAIDAAFALYLAGVAAITAHRASAWHNSETLWTAELRRQPRSAIAHNNIATFKYRTGDVPGALESVDRAVALDPEWHKALTNRAVLRDLAGRGDLARADYERSLALRPDQPLALNNRGKLKQEVKDLAGARDDFSAAITLDPRPMYYANRAECHAALGRAADAIADYTAALEKDPQRHDWYAERAILRAQTGDAAGALDDFSAVVRLVPNEPYAYLNRARARAAAGECAGAQEDVEAAARRGVRLSDDARGDLAKGCAALAPSGGSSTGTSPFRRGGPST